MKLFIQSDDGQLVATYIDGHFRMNALVPTEVIAFELFVILNKLMNTGAGAGFADSLRESTPAIDGDSDFGTAENPTE
jgi:hypothetical protein